MKKTSLFTVALIFISFNSIAQNVGIGTSTPGTKLTIQTPNNTDGFSHVSDGGIILKERVGGTSATIGTYSNHAFRLISNSADVINIIPDGNVGIGTSNPGNYRLKISQAFGGLALENPTTFDNWELYTVGGNLGFLEFFSNDVLKATINSTNGAYTAISDERLKTNIQPMNTMLAKIMSLKPCTYLFKNTKDQQAYNGFIAQEVVKIFPSLVNHSVIPERKVDVYTMDYSGFGVIAIKGIQEIQPIIEAQKEKIASLEARLAKLETIIASMVGYQSRK